MKIKLNRKIPENPKPNSMPFLVFGRGSFVVHIGIICGSGSFAVQFGDHFRSGDHLRSGIISGLGIICGRGSFPVWDHFRSGDHLRRCTALYFSRSQNNLLIEGNLEIVG